jgi:hypothetical protein
MWKVKNPLDLSRTEKFTKKPKTIQQVSLSDKLENKFFIKKKSNPPPTPPKTNGLGEEQELVGFLGFRVNMGIEHVNSKP